MVCLTLRPTCTATSATSQLRLHVLSTASGTAVLVNLPEVRPAGLPRLSHETRASLTTGASARLTTGATFAKGGMKKIQKVRLYGNDDRRPVRAHIDELHPLSRLRATIYHDRKTKLHCNVSRDVIRSIIASHRHNRLLIKGDVTVEELTLELDRDCVDIVRRQVDSDLPIARLCTRLANAIVSWPRMLRSMHNSDFAYDYSIGPTHAFVRFGRKPHFEQDIARNRPCKELVRAFCAFHRHMTMVQMKGLFQRHKLRAWLDGQPAFWFNDQDCGTVSINSLHRAMLQDAEFLEILLDELQRHWHTCPHLDAIFERFDETRHAPALDMLFDAIGKLGWSVTRSSIAETRKHPLVFPTAWVTTPRQHECSVGMLLEPPF